MKTGGRWLCRTLAGPRVADLGWPSFEGEAGAERELVAKVTPILRANDFCRSW